jgi:uncharacterized protein YydD (DUF2326 family)
MAVIMCPYCQPGDAWRGSIGRALWAVTKSQFIITILDSDIPENKEGSKIHFIENEIIKELSDKGEEGRLFKMDMF